jgi:hypothetical protein
MHAMSSHPCHSFWYIYSVSDTILIHTPFITIYLTIFYAKHYLNISSLKSTTMYDEEPVLRREIAYTGIPRNRVQRTFRPSTKISLQHQHSPEPGRMYHHPSSIHDLHYNPVTLSTHPLLLVPIHLTMEPHLQVLRYLNPRPLPTRRILRNTLSPRKGPTLLTLDIPCLLPFSMLPRPLLRARMSKIMRMKRILMKGWSM